MVDADLVEEVIRLAVEVGVLRRVKGVQGEYIDVNPAKLRELDRQIGLWGLWIAKELGLPKKYWLEVAAEMSDLDIYGEKPAEIDGIRLYLQGRKEEAEQVWRAGGVDEDKIRSYKESLEYILWYVDRVIRPELEEEMKRRERMLAGAPKWFDEYLVKKRLAELERMEKVHPDFMELNVLTPLKTAYRVFDWMHKKMIQKGTLNLTEVESYLRKMERRTGYDPGTIETIREEVKIWFKNIGEGKLSYRDLVDKVKGVEMVAEALLEKLAPLHMEKKQENKPYTREEVEEVKEEIRRKATSLKFHTISSLDQL